MLNKKEAVCEVLSLYEERDSLIRENEELCTKLNRLREEKKGEESNPLTEKLLRYGRERLMRDVISTWRCMSAYRTEGGGIRFSISSFEKWADDKVNDSDIPSYMCREDVMNILHEELTDLYLKEMKDAKKILLEKEAEAKEEAK